MMKKKKQETDFIPEDSSAKEPADKQTVRNPKDLQYRRKEPTLPDPEERRHHSEQPPSRHNTHS